MSRDKESKKISDIFPFDGKPIKENKKHEMVYDWENNPDYQPKYEIGNLDEFRNSREISGNIIIRKMETSGGTDVDWLIEHNTGFIILELKTIHNRKITVRKAQMIAYQNLHSQLKNIHIFFIGHEDINFKNPNDYIWFFKMEDWKNKKIPHEENDVSDQSFDSKGHKGYVFNIDNMEDITVNELRDKIDELWREFSRIKPKVDDDVQKSDQ